MDLVRYASDASPYGLTPHVVVLPRTMDEVVMIFRYCRENGRHATFRAAGTNLDGQSQSDDILIDVRRHWYGAKVENGGRRVRARAGMILGHVNALLGRHGRPLGPDPASSHACTVGGVIANNAGGMRCTVERNAYHTVTALTFVTPSGAVIDTSAPGAEDAFAANCRRAPSDFKPQSGFDQLRGKHAATRPQPSAQRMGSAVSPETARLPPDRGIEPDSSSSDIPGQAVGLPAWPTWPGPADDGQPRVDRARGCSLPIRVTNAEAARCLFPILRDSHRGYQDLGGPRRLLPPRYRRRRSPVHRQRHA
jgi:hypothetical protein